MTKKALIINFDGIGNLFMTYPLLSALEREHGFDLVLQDNPLWRDSEMVALLDFKRPPALIPTQWRRFHPRDWDAINAFVASAGVTHCVNLRNEGPSRDKHYMAFKEANAGCGLHFWDMHSLSPMLRVSQYDAMLAAFAHHGLDLSHARREWMAPLRPSPPENPTVGLFLGASKAIKRLPPSKWAVVADSLLANDVRVVLFSGTSPGEYAIARSLYADLLSRWGTDRVMLRHDASLTRVIKDMGHLSLLVSPDTMAVHAAAALGLPTIGLYVSTDGLVWTGGPKTMTVQSTVSIDCPQFKTDTGNCNLYDTSCPAPCADALDHHAAIHLALDLLQRSAGDAATAPNETCTCEN